MNIFVTGGLGFVGRHLCTGLLQDGHEVTAVGRSLSPASMIDDPSFAYISSDTTQRGAWQKQARFSDVVINLAGKSIFTRWTESTKQAIRDSRILTTRRLVEALSGARDKLLISTSAIGYYGDRGDDTLTESDPPGKDFLATVAVDWEYEALKLRSASVRVVAARFGIVLDRGGGAMAAMIPLFRFFLGGRLGDGRQWFPWIHMHDLVNAYRFIIENAAIAGPVNLCAPQPVRNRDLTRTLAESLNRPAMFPVPAFVVKGVLGEFGDSLLLSLRAVPAVLHSAGFSFTYNDIAEAIDDITRH